MTGLQTLIAAFAAIVLFIFGLKGFSCELQAAGGAAVAFAHLVFNVTIAVAFLVTLDRIEPRIRSRLMTNRELSQPDARQRKAVDATARPG